jgi:hypothetical protein
VCVIYAHRRAGPATSSAGRSVVEAAEADRERFGVAELRDAGALDYLRGVELSPVRRALIPKKGAGSAVIEHQQGAGCR